VTDDIPNSEPNTALTARWRSAWRAVGGDPPEETLQALLTAYGAADRRYHGLVHLQDCLAKLDTAAAYAGRPAEIEIALWFHDAVYDTHAPDNEALSAALAVETLQRQGIAEEIVARIEALILDTRHNATPETRDGQLLIDIDLSILGADEARFRAYEAAIREEYHWVPEDVFRAKRAEVLARFLARERIYQTPPFVERYEASARRNLRNSLRQLTGEPGAGTTPL